MQCERGRVCAARCYLTTGIVADGSGGRVSVVVRGCRPGCGPTGNSPAFTARRSTKILSNKRIACGVGGKTSAVSESGRRRETRAAMHCAAVHCGQLRLQLPALRAVVVVLVYVHQSRL